MKFSPALIKTYARMGQKGAAAVGEPSRNNAATTSQASPELMAEVEKMVEGVPDELKEKVFRAILASKLAEGEK